MLQNRHDAVQGAERIIQYDFTNTELCWEALQAKATGGYTEGNKPLAMVGDALFRFFIVKASYEAGNTIREFATALN